MTRDWFKTKLNHAEVLLALEEMAKFHACGLAYRMSLKVMCVYGTNIELTILMII